MINCFRPQYYNFNEFVTTYYNHELIFNSKLICDWSNASHERILDWAHLLKPVAGSAAGLSRSLHKGNNARPSRPFLLTVMRKCNVQDVSKIKHRYEYQKSIDANKNKIKNILKMVHKMKIWAHKIRQNVINVLVLNIQVSEKHVTIKWYSTNIFFLKMYLTKVLKVWETFSYAISIWFRNVWMVFK